MLRIRDVYPGSDFFPSRIPDPNCLHPGSRIRIKEFKYFNPKKKQKKWFLSSNKYDPGCSSRIPDPDADFLPIPDPGVKKAPDPGSGSATLHTWPKKLSPLGEFPIRTRETKEGWLLLIVETERNGDSKKSVNERGPSLVGSCASLHCAFFNCFWSLHLFCSNNHKRRTVQKKLGCQSSVYLFTRDAQCSFSIFING